MALQKADVRLGIMKEIMDGIKAIKLCAWESKFLEHITVARATLDLRAVIHTDWEGLGALHALLLQLESDALDGAAVVGPDGVEVPARAVPDKLALDAILRSS